MNARKALLRASVASGMMVVMATAVPTAAFAQPMAYQIRDMSLSRALREFARISGRQIIFTENLVRGRRAPALVGTFAPEEALARLLAGSGLRANTTPAGAIMIERAAQDTPVSGEAEAGGVAANSESADQIDDDEVEQEIVVTGTNIRGTSPVGSQLVVVDREEIERRGYESSADIVRDQTQNFNGGPSNDLAVGSSTAGAANRGASRNTFGGTSVNLRGLGSSSTLVLLNGQRLPLAGSDGTFSDISGIPVGAIERVEILPDGASALYGSDAVGGVVNYILRSNFEGGDTRLRISLPTLGGRQVYTLSQSFGLNWRGGNAILSGQYQRSTALAASQRAFSRSFDHRPQGGTDQRIQSSGVPGTITINNVTYAIPQNPNGLPPQALTFLPNTNTPRDVTEVDELYPTEPFYSAYAFASQELSSWLTARAQTLYSHRENRTRNPVVLNFTLRPANPYYFNPAGGTANIPVTYNLTPQVGPSEFSRDTDFVAASLGLTARLDGNWELRTNAAFSGSWSRSFNSQVNSFALNASAASTNPASAFNPFGGPNANAALVDDIFSSTQETRSRSRTKMLFAVIDGSPFALAGREVRVAAGAEIRQLDFNLSNEVVNQPFGADSLTAVEPTDRTVKSIFGEIFLPILGPEQGVERLNVSAAIRHERYSDFGRSTVPRFGLEFEPIRGFLIRGAYSRSFRAPDLTSLSGATSNATLATITDPAAPSGRSQALLVTGSVNTDLAPERGRTLSIGLDLAPPPLPNLRLAMTYFDIRYIDRLATIFTGVSINTVLRNPLYAEAIFYNPSPGQQSDFCASDLTPPVNCTSTPIAAIVDLRTRNVSTTSTNGVDIVLRYGFDVGRAGRLGLDVNATAIFTYRESLTRSMGLMSRLNESGNPIDLRVRAGLDYSVGPWSSSLTVNHIGPSVKIDRLATQTVRTPVSSLTTVDLALGHDWGDEAGLLSGLSIRLQVRNLFDTPPPFVDFTYGYDGSNFDPLGRVVSLSISKRW